MAVYLGMAAFLCAGSLLWSSQVEHLDTKKRKMLQDLFLLASGALFVLVLSLGGTGTTFTPKYACDNLTLGFPAYCVLLLTPSAMYLREAIVWNNLKFTA